MIARSDDWRAIVGLIALVAAYGVVFWVMGA